MERITNCCTLAMLAALLILFSSPGSCCNKFPFRSPTEGKPGGCGSDAAALKRFGDIDYDSFVSLMGRRSAVQPNDLRSAPMSREENYAGDINPILSGLLGQRNSQSKEDSQAKRGFFIHQGRLRFQRFV